VFQIEHGEVTSFEVIVRYVEALGGRLDLVADFGDRTVWLPVSDTVTAAWRQSRDKLERESTELEMELDSLKKPEQPH
jgi:hypothetical protein